ncbi:MAG: L-fucose mutarotase [Planctomycetaceae bacterium]
MLKGIAKLISPELMMILLKMGHGDELVLADGNFPSDSHAQRLVRADGLGAPALLEAILPLFPLDTFVDDPVLVMRPVDATADEPEIWGDFRRLLAVDVETPVDLKALERFEFYDRARKAYAIVATGESALYANLILKKGVVH